MSDSVPGLWDPLPLGVRESLQEGQCYGINEPEKTGKKNRVHRGAGGVKPGFRGELETWFLARELWETHLKEGQVHVRAKGLFLPGCQWPVTSTGAFPSQPASSLACPLSWGWKAESSPRWVGLVWLLGAKVNRSTSQPACQAWEQRRESGRTGEGSWYFPSPKAGT